MIMVFSNILLLTILFITTNSISGETVCTFDGANCAVAAGIQKSAVVSAIENAVAASDPIRLDMIKAYLPSVKYTLYNTTFQGLKDCTVPTLQIDTKKKVFHCDLECPHINVNADAYKMKGKVGEFSIQGEGSAHILIDNYFLQFECDYEKNVGKNNKEYIHITNYFLEVTPRGNVVIDFKNISAGDQEKTEKFATYVKENWKTIDQELRAPAINSVMDLFIEKVNNYLEDVSIDEILGKSS